MSNNIKKIRKIKNISVVSLAEKLGMSQGNLTKIENNQIELKPSLAEKIAHLLQVPLSELSDDLPALKITHAVSLPLLNPEDACLPKDTSLPMPECWLPNIPAAGALFYIADDAMGKKIPQGAFTLVNTDIQDLTKDGLYIIKEQNRLILRRLQQTGEEGVLILSDNHCYPPRQAFKNSLEIIAQALFCIKLTAL